MLPRTEMSKFAYLIVSHTNPAQVLRLARAIKRGSPSAHVVVHHDNSKSRLDLPADSSVHLLPDPVSVEWGGFSLVEMFLHSTAWMQEHLDFDWLVVVSGQDYPLQHLAAFEARLAASGKDGFLEYFPALGPAPWPNGTGKRRYYYRYIKLPSFPYYYLVPRALKDALARLKIWFCGSQSFVSMQTSPRGLGTKLGLRRITTPFRDGFVCYGGADWVNLNRKSIQTIHRFVEANPEIVSYYRRTFIPSESFVQTILVNDRQMRVANDACRYIIWEQSASASPAVLRTGDLESMLASGQPFARKFDLAIDADVLDLLDARLEQMLDDYER